MPRKKLANILLGFSFALFLNFEGILATLTGISISSGFLNQLYAPLFFVILSFSFAALYYLRIQEENKTVSILFVTTLVLSALIIGTSISWFDANKVFRDLIYIWLIYLFFQLEAWKKISDKYIDDYFIKSFVFSFLILFPLTNLLYTWGVQISRFSGWILSKPQFANMVFLAGIIYLISNFKTSTKHFIAFISFSLIVASGTRTTMLLFVIFYLYYFLIYKSERGLKRIAWFTGISAGVGVVVFLVFLPQIQTLFELAGNYRAFSIDDGGSVFSRISWYTTVFQSLYENNILGGFGAGASENLLGVLTHFDFLRFWYDYTIFFALIFMGNLFFIYFNKRSYRSKNYKFIDGSVLLIVIFTLMGHNVFQSFTMVVMIMFYLLMSNKSKKNELSARFYRVSISSGSGSDRSLQI